MAEPAAPPSSTISKREQKRQAKLAKELAEKAQAQGLESVDLAGGDVLPMLEKAEEITPEVSFEPKKSPYLEPVQKRIRNYLKKKQKIDQLTERANDGEEAKKLNKDQLETLARKDQILAPLKELQNLAEQFNEIETEHNTALKAEASESSKASASAIQAAKAEGLEEGKKILSSLIAFLGYASVLRSSPSPDPDFNDANERLLSVVYLGGDDSLKAAVSLDAGSEDLIEDTKISFKQVRDAIQQQSSSADQVDTPVEIPEAATDASPVDDNKPYASANLISLSDVAKQAPTIGTGGISFLNESEIEGSRQPESEATGLQASEVAAPMQTLATEAVTPAKAIEVDWNASVVHSNWADEDSSDPPVPDSDPVAVPSSVTSVTSSQAKQPQTTTPVDEFKTVEKKPATKDGRGKGQGSGRRDDREGGRGRGRGRGGGGAHRGERGDKQ